MKAKSRFRLDVLRRQGTALAAAVGVPAARASALVAHLLWYDSAGLGEFGAATLPDYLGRIERGEIDPAAEGRVGPERAGSAVLDGRRGVPPLILARAAELAGEKAREVGLGLVRVGGIGPAGPAAAVAAELAIGPQAGLVLGPGGSWTMALPSAEGLPLVHDSALAGEAAGPAPPWSALVPEGGWLVLALAASAVDSLADLHGRVAGAAASGEDRPGVLRPEAWEARRKEARERGVLLPTAAVQAWNDWAGRLGVEPIG